MLAALAEAGAATGTPELARRGPAGGRVPAGRAARAPTGAGCARGSPTAGARHHALAADHAALVDAFVALAEATGEARWIDEARLTADAAARPVLGRRAGRRCSPPADDGEALIVRQKDLLDNATPSANSLAAVGLLPPRRPHRRGPLHQPGRPDPAARRRRRGRRARRPSPTSSAPSTCAAGRHHRDRRRRRPARPGGGRRSVRYLPNAVLAWGEPYDSPLWYGRRDGLAYVCRDYHCEAPVDTVEALGALLA